MSRTYSLGCSQCEVEVWIGQGSHLYKTEDYLKTLEEFLFKHQNHPLSFYDDEGSNFRTLNLPEE